MRRSTLLSSVLVVFVLATFLTGYASAQSGGPAFARITSVNAPSTVSSGRSLTVTVNATYQYNSNFNQSLYIEIANSSQGSNPFPATAISGSCSNPKGESNSVCLANTTKSCTSDGSCSGSFTTSFTLTAPNQTETWTLYVFGQITEPNLNQPQSYNVVTQNDQIVQVSVT